MGGEESEGEGVDGEASGGEGVGGEASGNVYLNETVGYEVRCDYSRGHLMWLVCGSGYKVEDI